MNTPRLAPSILTCNFLDLENEIKQLEKAKIEMLHLDIMDGHFVPNLTFGPNMIKQIRQMTTLQLDVHLMISNPDLYIETYAKSGADYISIHIEASDNVADTLQHIRRQGCKAGLAVKPDTPIDQLYPFLPLIDFVVIMSVFPGFGGQKFIPESLEKVRTLKTMIEEKNLTINIEIDGGVNESNIAEIKEAGTDFIVAGSSIFNHKRSVSENVFLLNKHMGNSPR